MLDTHHLPDLTFSMVKLGRRETPWDLKPLLYRGGAAANAGKVAAMVSAGKLGSPQLERLDLVKRLHEAIAGKLLGGGSKTTHESVLSTLRVFFTWAEEANHPLTLDDVSAAYLHWTDSLVHRVQVVKDLLETSAYTLALTGC